MIGILLPSLDLSSYSRLSRGQPLYRTRL